MDIGYVRISTVGQNISGQLDGVDLEHTFTEKASVNDTNRPELVSALRCLRAGDTLHVDSIDRLARNMVDLLDLVKSINGMGASVHFHKEALYLTGDDSPMQTLQLQLMTSFAQFERSLINERAAEGRQVAIAKGVKFGRKPKFKNTERQQVLSLLSAGVPARKIALDLDMSRQTVYRIKRDS